jgi:hypothetical protein
MKTGVRLVQLVDADGVGPWKRYIASTAGTDEDGDFNRACNRLQ